MATEMVPLSGLARRLVEDGLLDTDAANNAANEARKEGTPFITYLVRNEVASARDIAVSASEEFGVPLIDLASFDPDAIPRDLVKERLIRTHNALPLVRRGVSLFVAVSDPTNLQGLDELKFQSGTNTEPVLIEEAKLAKLIEAHLNAGEADQLGDLDEGKGFLGIRPDKDRHEDGWQRTGFFVFGCQQSRHQRHGTGLSIGRVFQNRFAGCRGLGGC